MFRNASGKMKEAIVIRFVLEIYTLSTCSDVMSDVEREPEVRHAYGR